MHTHINMPDLAEGLRTMQNSSGDIAQPTVYASLDAIMCSRVAIGLLGCFHCMEISMALTVMLIFVLFCSVLHSLIYAVAQHIGSPY